MLLENAESRVYLGVHWIFDAFDTRDDGRPALDHFVGGVPLGLRIAQTSADGPLAESPI